MSLDATSYAAALKEMFPEDILRNLTYMDNPFLGIIPKNENAGGETIDIPVLYANAQGRSATISTAVTNKGQSSSLTKFQVTLADDYGVGSIARKLTLQSTLGGKKAAVADAGEIEMNSVFNQVTRSLAISMYRSSDGYIGVVGTSGLSVANPMVVTLSDANDATNFEVGMILVADNNSDGSSLKTTPGTATVDGLDRIAGTITTDYDNSGGATNWADADYLFVQGDEAAKMSGLDSWIPTSNPSATTFFGVDRTVDYVRLSGVRHDATGQGPDEAIFDLCRKISQFGCTLPRPDSERKLVALMNPLQWGNLVKSVQTLATYERIKTQATEAEVYFDGVVVNGPMGPVECYPDRNCPADRIYVLQLSDWVLLSLLEAPHIFDKDNDQKMLRESGDAYEFRVGYYAGLACYNPGGSGVAHSLSTS